MPKRIFMGSERGELASTSDDDNWNDRLKGRNATFTTPRVVVPFVNRCINLNIVTKPKGFSVEWPDLTSTSNQQRGTYALTFVQALAAYETSNLATLITFQDFLVQILGMDDEVAEGIEHNASQGEANNIDAEIETEAD